MRCTFKELVGRYKFWSFSDLIENVESHAISCALKQLPSMIFQNILPNSSAESAKGEPQTEQDVKKKLFGSFAKSKK